MTEAPTRECDLLIDHAFILTVDRHDSVIENGAIAISGTDIVAIGRRDEIVTQYAPYQRIDANGGVVHPGFIDAHIHVSQYTSRSVLPRMDGTSITMGDWKAALRPEDEHDSAALAAVDYLKAGYTGFVDPGTIFEPDAVASVAEEIGIRIWLTDPYVSDRGHLLAEHQPELVSGSFLGKWPRNTDEALDRLGKQLARNRNPAGIVHGFIGIYGADTASPNLTEAALAMARGNAVQFQEHRRYSPIAHRSSEAGSRSTINQLLDDGVLGVGTTFVHMNVVHADDVEMLAKSGTAVVWCPYSQMRMIGSERAEPRMIELCRLGVPIGLATDIPRSVRFEALGTLAHANAAVCGTPASPAEILRMRTIDAATTIGAAQWTGSLEYGKRADIVINAPGAPEALGVDPIWETAILRGTAPAAVIVNGKRVLEDGTPVRVEPAVVAVRARESARALMRRVGLSN